MRGDVQMQRKWIFIQVCCEFFPSIVMVKSKKLTFLLLSVNVQVSPPLVITRDSILG